MLINSPNDVVLHSLSIINNISASLCSLILKSQRFSHGGVLSWLLKTGSYFLQMWYNFWRHKFATNNSHQLSCAQLLRKTARPWRQHSNRIWFYSLRVLILKWTFYFTGHRWTECYRCWGRHCWWWDHRSKGPQPEDQELWLLCVDAWHDAGTGPTEEIAQEEVPKLQKRWEGYLYSYKPLQHRLVNFDSKKLEFLEKDSWWKALQLLII